MVIAGRQKAQRPVKRKRVFGSTAARFEKPAETSATKQQLELVDPRTCGIDPKVIYAYEASMQKLVGMGVLPGAASMVLRRGKVIQRGCWGRADIRRRTRFSVDTLCRLYCMTKSYVATAFMTLVDEGRASLEDRLSKFLPEFASVRVLVEGASKSVKAKRAIRLKHLLSHTSGIDYAPDLGTSPEGDVAKAYQALQLAVQRGSVRTLKSFVTRLSKLPLSNHPGEGYYYGYSMDVLARVVEILMGKDLKSCLQQRVFQPLGMKDTWWSVPDDQLHRLAALYSGPSTWGHLYGGSAGAAPRTARKGLLRIDGGSPLESNWRQGRQCRVLSGGGFMGYLHGGLVSTVADTARFVHMLVNRGVAPGGQRLLQEKTLALMEVNRLKKSWGSGKACYLGNVGVFREGGQEFGMGGAACTYWSVDRKEDIATVWFTQHVDMPEMTEISGINAAKADLWRALHDAVQKGSKAAGKKRRRADGDARSSGVKRARRRGGGKA